MDALSISPAPSNAVFGLGLSSGSGYPLSAAATKSSKIGGIKSNGGLNSSVGSMTKPKQSKSRNGCVTCKGKRLKCDESKPTCQQCLKRGVPCGGYKKDFKWRPFEEANIVGKSSKPSRKNNGLQKQRKDYSSQQPIAELAARLPSPEYTTIYSEAEFQMLSNQQFEQMQYEQFSTMQPIPSNNMSYESPVYILPRHVPMELPISPQTATFKAEHAIPSPTERGSPNYCTNPASQGDASSLDIDLVLMQSKDAMDALDGLPFNFPMSDEDGYGLAMPNEEEIEEIVRTTEHDYTRMQPAPPPPSPDVQLRTTRSRSLSAAHRARSCKDRLPDIFRRPSLGHDSPEALASYFDRYTCGIMSVKDGPTENPWRTLIWRLSKESPALHHAVSSMTAFHMAKKQPDLRLEGVDHARKSLRFLAQGLSHSNIMHDAALATTLVLTFSEAFDNNISSGRGHLRGAKVLLDVAIKSRMSRNSLEQQRLLFLYNVWIYLDVLARLSANEEDADDHHQPHVPWSYPQMHMSRFSDCNQIDPLLGCAVTLFPIIGQVAELVSKVRKSETDNSDLIARAFQLKAELDSWSPGDPLQYELLEDESNHIEHCIYTAEAYRWATLLYLHQAVPEVPSHTSAQLARNVLQCIKLVPAKSRSCIVHIYPLLAAGCEAVGRERLWVKDRWEGMSSMMGIGNLEKAYEVLRQVWERRDRFAQRWAGRNATAQLSLFPPGYELSSAAAASGSNTAPQFRNGATGFLDEFRTPGGQLPYDLNEMLADSEPMFKKRTMSDPLHGVRRCFPHMEAPTFEFVDSCNTEHLPEEFGVRGSLHWLGVMKEWGWEVLLG